MKGCLKGCLTSIILLIAFLVVLGFLGWRYIKKQFLTTSQISPTATILEIDTGTVTRNGSLARTGDTLASGDKIHTAKNSAATLTFPDNSVLRLDENTDAAITSASNLKISIFQPLGRTWSRVTKLSNAGHSYEITTPTAIAAARGTAFATNVNLDQSTNIDTDNDVVTVSAPDRKNPLSVEASFGIDLAVKQQKLFKRPINADLKNSPWYQNNQLRDKQLTEKLSRTAHWITVVRNLIPLLSKLQPLRFVSTE